MQFVHQPLVWGFLLVLLPLLIHLINMLRHKRVEWAAMEFLLASYRKHRRWVWLKQLMLLLLRMGAVAAVVAMLAQLVTQAEWSRLFGQRTTHHFVLLDDSLSMDDRSGNGSAFDRGRRAISQLTADASSGDQQQRITLLRYSAAHAGSAELAATLPDLNAEPIVAPLEVLLERRGRTLTHSQLALQPRPALEIIEKLIGATRNEQCVLHVVSDFRRSDWSEPAEIREILTRLARSGTEIQLVRCVENSAANLAITSLSPEVGTQAAGVPLLMQAVIKNLSDEPVQRVRLRAKSTFYPQ